MPSALRNVLSNWAGFACASITSFFLSPFVVHHLGNSGYGIWVFLGSLTGYLGLLNFGVRGAVTRYVARFHVEGNHQEASAVTSSALLIFVVAGMLSLLLALVCAAFVLPMFHVSRDYQSAARVVVILGGVNIAVSLIFGVFGGVVAALHRFDLSNRIEIAEQPAFGVCHGRCAVVGQGNHCSGDRQRDVCLGCWTRLHRDGVPAVSRVEDSSVLL